MATESLHRLDCSKYYENMFFFFPTLINGCIWTSIINLIFVLFLPAMNCPGCLILSLACFVPGSRGLKPVPGWWGCALLGCCRSLGGEAWQDPGSRAMMVAEIWTLCRWLTGSVVNGNAQAGTVWWRREKMGKDWRSRATIWGAKGHWAWLACAPAASWWWLGLGIGSGRFQVKTSASCCYQCGPKGRSGSMTSSILVRCVYGAFRLLALIWNFLFYSAKTFAFEQAMSAVWWQWSAVCSQI